MATKRKWKSHIPILRCFLCRSKHDIGITDNFSTEAKLLHSKHIISKCCNAKRIFLAQLCLTWQYFHAKAMFTEKFPFHISIHLVYGHKTMLLDIFIRKCFTYSIDVTVINLE